MIIIHESITIKINNMSTFSLLMQISFGDIADTDVLHESIICRFLIKGYEKETRESLND